MIKKTWLERATFALIFKKLLIEFQRLFVQLPLWIVLTLWGGYGIGITVFAWHTESVWRILALSCQILLLIIMPIWGRRWQFVISYVVLLALITGVFLYMVQPSNERNWEASSRKNAYAEWIDNDTVKLVNVRDFHYRTETDFDAEYRDITLDLTKIAGVDFIVVYWMGEAIGHTMVSFRFTEGENICFSMEVRKLQGEDYNMLSGIFRQNELICIAGTERDLIGLRTNFRHELVYLYPTNSTAAQARDGFFRMLNRLNELAEQPEFYNTITRNCTSSLLPMAKDGKPRRDFRILFNGFSDQLAFEDGTLKLDKPNQEFAELKANRYINNKVDKKNIYEDGFDFSDAIRKFD